MDKRGASSSNCQMLLWHFVDDEGEILYFYGITLNFFDLPFPRIMDG